MIEWLDSSAYAVWFRESLWGWPAALTIHAFGTAIVIGFIFIISLRLIGLFRTIPYSAMNKLFPIIWFAIVLQVLSSYSLWMTKPARYLGDGMFESKLTLVIVSIIVTAYFHRVFSRGAAEWEKAGRVSSRAVKWAAVTTILWAGVLVAGRLTAYLGSLYMS